MCGIVGSISHSNVVPELLDGLSNIEYRGYDSAGISVQTDAGISTVKQTGKLQALRDLLSQQLVSGNAGIGHTRWATHGEPNTRNAHPHTNDHVAVVHNGIIENHHELRQWLNAEGFIFRSQTDTEVIPHLISYYYSRCSDPAQALNQALERLQGAFALGVLFNDDAEHIYAARRGSPLVLGCGEAEMSLGSDTMALGNGASQVIYMEEGDQACLGQRDIELVDAFGRTVSRKRVDNDIDHEQTGKQNHSFYMHKEIHEQPDTVARTLVHSYHLKNQLELDFMEIDRLSIIACGTSYYAAMVAKYWFEQLAALPVDIDVASEFRYRSPLMSNHGLAVFISQSGETADTLAALKYARSYKQQTLAVVNVAASSIAREADMSVQTQAGPEIGVASTKAFTAQLSVLGSLAIQAAQQRRQFSPEMARAAFTTLASVPQKLEQILSMESQLEAIGNSLADARDAYFIGRGSSYPIAMEGALKLKEISYIHAEGFGAGELKHGPIALIESGVPVFVIAPNNDLLEKTLSNMQEVVARGGRCILLGDKHSIKACGDDPVECIEIPESDPFTSPLLYVTALQLIAYYAALAKGTDVDQPRNLAKSVTVE
ncbi:glutamine--fructose-6-phosphate transaminase (isomerizing) [Aliamphritea hakodatensis]|uniref:glutamine--fructose-6-phosphate transaminase (isomerizing) n=1 Tax=Aliamphritea hakodatensis TaxID=2895352 RepID=UPI0022FD6717|nr:glutamine--fructose-6-phosphate transaminase (isomerizing) [Aliamphritea hakodatensis]